MAQDTTLRLLDDLQEMVVNARHVGMLKWTFGINPDEVGMLISKIRATLPTEVKQAAHTVLDAKSSFASEGTIPLSVLAPIHG